MNEYTSIYGNHETTPSLNTLKNSRHGGIVYSEYQEMIIELNKRDQEMSVISTIIDELQYHAVIHDIHSGGDKSFMGFAIHWRVI